MLGLTIILGIVAAFLLIALLVVSSHNKTLEADIAELEKDLAAAQSPDAHSAEVEMLKQALRKSADDNREYHRLLKTADTELGDLRQTVRAIRSCLPDEFPRLHIEETETHGA